MSKSDSQMSKSVNRLSPTTHTFCPSPDERADALKEGAEMFEKQAGKWIRSRGQVVDHSDPDFQSNFRLSAGALKSKFWW